MASNTLIDPDQYDFENQMAYANALRKRSMDAGGQMIGNIYVAKNPWLNFAEGLVGSAIGRNSLDTQRQQVAKREGERNDWLAKMPQATEVRPQFGPTQDGGNLPDVQVDRDPNAYNRDMTAWGMNAPVGMDQARQFALQQTMTQGEKLAARKDAREMRTNELLLKSQEAAALQQQRLEDQRQRDRERFQDRKDLMQFGASLRPPPAPHNAQVITTDQGMLERQPDGSWAPIKVGDTIAGKPFAPPRSGGGKGPTTEQAKQYEIESLDELIRRTKELKSSPGLPTVTGPVAGRLPGAAFMTNQDASNAVSTYDKYMEFLQTKGLQDLKARGISPGSITEKEWPKFVARLTSLDRVKGGKEVNSELDRMMVDAYNTRAKVSGTGDTFHNVDGRIYRLLAGADPKRKSSYEEVQ